MKDISSLLNSLNVFLKWNKARIECFSLMLLGLFAVKTVNLKEISLAFRSDAKISSRYRRLQRFFASFEMDYTKIALWIFKLFFTQNDKLYLIIDRTNWFWGKKKINVFMLAVAYEGLAIPLFWALLPKAGSSNFKEQKELLNRFINTFGISPIEGLLADREFGSGSFFKWLSKKKIPFYIRIKEGSMACIKNKKFYTAKKLFNELNPKTYKAFEMNVEIFGQSVYLAGSRSERGELMIVATNTHTHVKNAIAIYLRRWEIESLFQSLKGRGFRFEETHITDLERIKKLVVILALGFVWAHRIGEWLASKKPIIQKIFKKQRRPQNSYFRYGLDSIREVIFSFKNKGERCQKYINLIIPLSGDLVL